MDAVNAPLAGRRAIVVSLALALVAGGCGRRRRGADDDGSPPAERANPDGGAGEAVESRLPVRAPSPASRKAIAAAVQPSVVSVRARSDHGRTPIRTGSGFAIDDKGHVLTNAHVVAGAGAVTLVLRDGRTVDATVVGAEEAADIAVLQASVAGIPPAFLGSSSKLQVGTSVLAIGAAQAPVDSVTSGIVSALRRRMALSRSGPREELVQTDAAVSRGTTGGPLVDMSGQVVGVTTLLAAPDATGLGFAVPVERAVDLARRLIG